MLVSTSDIRNWIALPEGDRTPNAKLQSVAQAVQDFVETVTNRQLEARTYYNDTEFSILDGNGRPWIYLPQYPVSYIDLVAIDSDREFGSGTEISDDDIYWYPTTGKVMSEGGYFTRGRRNVRIDYKAGYAPVVGGTHNGAVSTYPIPHDLKQVMVEMAVESLREGLTAVHTIAAGEQSRMVQLLTSNSFWSKTIAKYQRYDIGLDTREE